MIIKTIKSGKLNDSDLKSIVQFLSTLPSNVDVEIEGNLLGRIASELLLAWQEFKEATE